MDNATVIKGTTASTVKSLEKVAPVGMPKTIRIILEENDNIPPTGQYFGHNGTGYILRPGEPADVPLALIGILDDAIVSITRTNPLTGQPIGTNDRLRFPYRIVN